MATPPSSIPPKPTLSDRLKDHFNQFRHSLSYVEALPQLTFLGLIVGLLTGGIIVVFRLMIELPLGQLIPAGPDRFEDLPETYRAVMIGTGLALVYGIIKVAGKAAHQVSVSHVLDRLHNFQGHMPARNWLVQFFGGVVCIISGQSVGREGPAIHLGAGVASRLGRWLRLPNNSRFSLFACGVAAAISASFDTPMAGVIFAMEVIVMEYTIVGFVPVILASVSGSTVSRAVFENTAPMLTTRTNMESLLELPFMVASGLLIAVAAAIFISLHVRVLKLGHWPLSLRFALAGALTIVVAWQIPQVMGLGYDTLNLAVAGELTAYSLIAVALAKMVVSPIAVGLGVPGGLIGPTLVTGACIGGALGIAAQQLYSSPTADPGFYVILGMTGMMAAVLNAPLAALVAVLELSYNPHMIFPSMAVIVIACVSTRYFFGFDGIFIEQLKHSGRGLEFKPAVEALKRAGLGSVINSNLVYTFRKIDYEQARALLVKTPDWIVLDFNDAGTKDKVALRAADLATYLEQAPVEVLSLVEDIDLLAIPARRLVLSPIHETATLWEALQALRGINADALYVSRGSNPLGVRIQGVITEESITHFYQV